MKLVNKQKSFLVIKSKAARYAFFPLNKTIKTEKSKELYRTRTKVFLNNESNTIIQKSTINDFEIAKKEINTIRQSELIDNNDNYLLNSNLFNSENYLSSNDNFKMVKNLILPSASHHCLGNYLIFSTKKNKNIYPLYLFKINIFIITIRCINNSIKIKKF